MPQSYNSKSSASISLVFRPVQPHNSTTLQPYSLQCLNLCKQPFRYLVLKEADISYVCIVYVSIFLFFGLYLGVGISILQTMPDRYVAILTNIYHICGHGKLLLIFFDRIEGLGP